MSHTPVIDSIAFARAGSHCQGTMQGERLTRLDDSLVDRAGEVQYEVRGIRVQGWSTGFNPKTKREHTA
ncbi:MAG: hypothetical protein K2W80_04070, partial [Burkholderiales bacterium]|nr:hypothetical protein [Burkholderiales bacterium]